MQCTSAPLLTVCIFGARARRTGVGSVLGDPGAYGQVDGGFRAFDGECPEIAGHIPVKLVVTAEESDLPVCGVGDCVRVSTRGHEAVSASGLDPLPIFNVLDIVRFIPSIARNMQDVEA